MKTAASGNHQEETGTSVALSGEPNTKEADFQASSNFVGPKNGFVYTTGEQGTGYYKDTPLHLRKPAAKAKPAMLKTNSSIVKNIPRRNVPLPDAKKRKTAPHGKASVLHAQYKRFGLSRTK
eukprot:gene10644-10802_t